MEKLLDSLQSSLGQSLPGVAGAAVILLIGWIAAMIVRAVLKKGLHLCRLDERLNSDQEESSLKLESGIASGGYFVVLLFALLAVFNQLGLEVASQPIQGLLTQIFDFIPKLFGGGILILVAWVCGRIAKQIITGLLAATSLDKKVQTRSKPISQSLGEVAYWLVFLVFLPGILDVFQLQGLLTPAQSMIDKMMGMIPNIFAATIIVGVGWFIARIFRDLVSNVLAVAGLDQLGEKAGIKGNTKLSSIVGTLVYLFVFIPAIIAGLNALKIAAIAEPATQLLATVLALIPNLIGAIAIVGITYFVAKPVSGFVGNLLSSIGFDNLPQQLGFKASSTTGATPSRVIAKLALFFMMLFATVEAANRLAFTQLSQVLSTIIQFGGQILVGSAIIAVGLWIANIVSQGMQRASGKGGNPMATLVRVVILGLVFSMGLRAMGLANDIVNIAFGLTLGSAAIAFALSFGLGGREAAGRQMEYWFSSLRSSPANADRPAEKAAEFLKK